MADEDQTTLHYLVRSAALIRQLAPDLAVAQRSRARLLAGQAALDQLGSERGLCRHCGGAVIPFRASHEPHAISHRPRRRRQSSRPPKVSCIDCQRKMSLHDDGAPSDTHTDRHARSAATNAHMGPTIDDVAAAAHARAATDVMPPTQRTSAGPVIARAKAHVRPASQTDQDGPAKKKRKQHQNALQTMLAKAAKDKQASQVADNTLASFLQTRLGEAQLRARTASSRVSSHQTMARHAPHRCHCSRSVTYAVKLLGDMLALKNQGLHVHASVCRTDSVDRIAPVQGRADGLSSARLCSDSSECRDALLRVLWNRLLPPRASKFYDATLAYRDGQDEVIDTSGRGELAADPVTMPMPTEQLDSAKTSMRQSSNPSQPELAVSGGYLSQENSPGSSPLASSSSSLMSSARLSRPIGSRHSSFRTSQCFLSPNEEIVMPYFLSETQSPPSSSRSSLSSRSGQKSLAMTTIGPDSYRMELQGWTAPGEPEAYSNARYRQAKISQRVALRHERKAGKALTRGDMKSYERSRSQASTAWRECLSDLEEARMPARIG